MKKLLLSAACVVALTAVDAQTFQAKEAKGRPANIPAKAPKAVQMNKAGNDITDWYNPVSFWERSNVGGQFASNRFVNFIMHDSLAKTVNDNGSVEYGNGATSIGQVIDPKDELISSTDNPGILLSGYVKYKVDSIRFTYLYVRNTDSTQDELGQTVPVYDTLFVAYFTGNQIGKSSNTTFGKYSSPSFAGGSVRMPSNYFKLDTLVFGPGTTDSTAVNNNNGGFENSWRLKTMQLAAPANMNVNPTVNATTGAVSFDLAAASIVFKPGVKSVRNVGGVTDTAVMLYQRNPATNPIPAGTRRTNYFGYLQFSNPSSSGLNFKNTAYTNSLITYPIQAYDATRQNYIPGHGFITQQFVDMDFLISTTSGNVGLADHELVSIGNVYPNPANGSTTVTFNTQKTANVTVSLTNLLGQEVASVNAGKLAAGVNQVNLNLSNIKAGVYFVNVTADGARQTKKLTVTE